MIAKQIWAPCAFIAVITCAMSPPGLADIYVSAQAGAFENSAWVWDLNVNQSTTERLVTADYTNPTYQITSEAAARSVEATSVGVFTQTWDSSNDPPHWQGSASAEADEYTYLISDSMGQIAIPLEISASLAIPSGENYHEVGKASLSFGASFRVKRYNSWNTLALWTGGVTIVNNSGDIHIQTISLPDGISYTFSDGVFSLSGTGMMIAPIEYINATYQITSTVSSGVMADYRYYTPDPNTDPMTLTSSVDCYNSLGFGGYLWDEIVGTAGIHDRDNPDRSYVPEPVTGLLLMAAVIPAWRRRRS